MVKDITSDRTSGSLTREALALEYDMATRQGDEIKIDWGKFSAALTSTKPGNDGYMMLPYVDTEITPVVLEKGVIRLGNLPERGGYEVAAEDCEKLIAAKENIIDSVVDNVKY